MSTDFTELQARLDDLAAAADRLALVPSVIGKLDYLRANGLGDLLDDLATRRVAADAVADEFEFVWWRAVLARTPKPTASMAMSPAMRFASWSRITARPTPSTWS